MDTGKTKDDNKGMDVNKAKQDVGQVNKDVQGLKESVMEMPSNPLAVRDVPKLMSNDIEAGLIR